MITQRDVNRYARNSAVLAALKKRQDELKSKIIAALKAGEKCPDGGPFLLGVQSTGIQISWKSLAEDLAEKYDALETLAKMVLEARKNAEPGETIKISINPEWGQKRNAA